MFCRRGHSICSIVFFSFFICSISIGQTVKFEISLEMDRLLPQEQEILRPLTQQLQDYVNNFNWSDENKEVIIECTANLIVETMNPRGSDKIYRSQFLVSSPSGENYYDKSCEFIYQQGQGMSHNRAIFAPLLGLIDYYIYMVLGGELDTWLLRGGSKYYDMALNVANEGSISNYSTGWSDRVEAVKLITDSDHIPLREAKFYYYDCLYYIEAKNDRPNAMKLSQLVLQNLEKVHHRRPNSPALKRFFDSHFKEICSLFAFTDNNNFVESLSNMDPRHSETYQACGEKKKI
jgi:Domain of unknown function (DUF4835)